MAIDAFRDVQMDCPDEERRELVDGVPIMMTPTHLGHTRVASNIQRLPSDALDAFDADRTALHDIGVDLGLAHETLVVLGRADRYAPQPDVGVIDAVFGQDQRFASRLYVAIEQRRVEVRLSTRTAEGWSTKSLTRLDDPLILPTCGITCTAGDLYRGTTLGPTRHPDIAPRFRTSPSPSATPSARRC